MDLTQFRVVPVEPTVQMIDAGLCGCMDNDVTVCVHRNLLAAAPTENVPVLIDPAELAALRQDAERWKWLDAQGNEAWEKLTCLDKWSTRQYIDRAIAKEREE